MMIRRAHRNRTSPLGRGAWGLLALVHLLTLGLAPLADAHHGAGEEGVDGSSAVQVAAHASPGGSHDCVGPVGDPCDPGHGHDDCVLCRALSTGALALDAASGAEDVQAPTVAAAIPPVSAPTASGALSPHSARAPPRV